MHGASQNILPEWNFRQLYLVVSFVRFRNRLYDMGDYMWFEIVALFQNLYSQPDSCNACLQPCICFKLKIRKLILYIQCYSIRVLPVSAGACFSITCTYIKMVWCDKVQFEGGQSFYKFLVCIIISCKNLLSFFPGNFQSKTMHFAITWLQGHMTATNALQWSPITH